jgi:hypothetical protein
MTAQTARTLLTAMTVLVEQLVEATLKKIDEMTAGGGLSLEQAMACCHEIAAYRRIVQRLRTRVAVTDRQAGRLMAEGYTEPANG